MSETIEKAPSAEGALSEMSSAGYLGNSENRPPRSNTQIKFRNPRAVLRRRRLVEHLHSLGPSPLGHFIREVEDAARVDVTSRLERYAEIDPEFVRALGGDKFPPRFLHGIGAP
jgi:hypothetical protein